MGCNALSFTRKSVIISEKRKSLLDNFNLFSRVALGTLQRKQFIKGIFYVNESPCMYILKFGVRIFDNTLTT